MGSNQIIDLIPWDSESEAHVQRLFDQRISCGWNSEKVEKLWKQQQRSGTKCIYWIVPTSAELLPGVEKLRDEKGFEELQDTASTIRGVQRSASGQPFSPIGHISIDQDIISERVTPLDLPDKVIVWIKTFYIAKNLRGGGLGRTSMDVVEKIATEEPWDAQIIMLDTAHREDQSAEHRRFYGEAPKLTNQDWYERRGYRLIKTILNHYRLPEEIGVLPDIRTVFMRKDIG